tara:strand:+ start:1093 stop:1335 length:243 start_codon:yes stop_codon:yes gene_type:complete
MQTKTIFKNAKVLWQNKTWSIEKLSQSEIIITNGNDICYAYLSSTHDGLVVDRIIYPKYIQNIAIKFASKNITSIYNKVN